jgi:hypothetical protein
MRNKLFILTIIAIVFFGCKKNDSSASSGGTTKTTLITQQSWVFNNAGLDPDKDGSINTDVSGFVTPCLKDNTVNFESNGSGTSDEGPTKCNVGDLQSIPFSWDFANNETEININGNAVAGKGGRYKIISLTNTNLSLSKDTVYMSLSTTFIVNLKH